MYHVSSRETTEKVVALSENLRKSLLGIPNAEKTLAEVKRVLGNFRLYEKLWEAISDELDEHPPFDRLYLEGKTYSAFSEISKDSAMYKCIRRVQQRGARLMTTESEFWLQLALLSMDLRVNRMEEFCHKMREISVTNRIDLTLKEGERGILFFGAGHKPDLVARLSSCDLSLNILGRN